jgi:hypothetical protein
VSGNVNEFDNRRVRSVRRTRRKKVMMTNKTHRTATCQLLAKVALVGAAIAVPMTAAAFLPWPRRRPYPVWYRLIALGATAVGATAARSAAADRTDLRGIGIGLLGDVDQSGHVAR